MPRSPRRSQSTHWKNALVAAARVWLVVGLGACSETVVETGSDGGRATSGASAAGAVATTSGSGSFSGETGIGASGMLAGTGATPIDASGSATTGSGGGTSGAGGTSLTGLMSGEGGIGNGGDPDAGSSDSGGTADSSPPCMPSGGTITGCVATVPTAIFGTSCSAFTCHNAKDHAYGLDLVTIGVAARLFDVRAVQNTPSTNYKLIDPQTPSSSYILLKVKMIMPPLGAQMPSTGPKLSPQEEQCLLDWVVAEATNCGEL